MNSMQHLSVFSAVFRRLLFAPGFSRREKGMLSYKLSRLQPGFSIRLSKEREETRLKHVGKPRSSALCTPVKENLVPSG